MRVRRRLWMPACAGMTAWRRGSCHPRKSGGPANRARTSDWRPGRLTAMRVRRRLWMPACAGMTAWRRGSCHPRKSGGPANRREPSIGRPGLNGHAHAAASLDARVRGHDSVASRVVSPPQKRGSSKPPRTFDWPPGRLTAMRVRRRLWMPACAGMTAWRRGSCHPRKSGGPANRREPSIGRPGA